MVVRMASSGSHVRRIFDRTGHFFKDQTGAGAIEFGVFASILVPLFLIAIDIGFVLRERIVLDHVLRMGAYTAIDNNPSPERVEDVMRVTLEDQQSPRITLTSLRVDRTCFCRSDPATDLICSTNCAPVNRVEAYDMRVTVTYNSIFLPHALSLNLSVLSASLRVEIPSIGN